MMTPELYEACKHAIHVIEPNGTVSRAGRAAMLVMQGIGYRKLGKLGLLPPFIWCIELGYWLVARNRGKVYRWFLKGACRPLLETEFAKQAQERMQSPPTPTNPNEQ
jgi:predicted DCC family thiol-disulfide oxidoreductase YuxK